MKKFNIKMICAIVLLVNAAPQHCMLRRAASWRPATSGMSREAAARLVTAQQKERLSLGQSVVGPKPDTSTLSGLFQSGVNWFKSLLQRSPVESEVVQPVSYAVRTRTVPFGARGYSTMPVPSGGESRVKVSQNELIESTSRPYVAPASSKPGWFSGKAAQQAYDYFLETMNTLKSGQDIGMSRMIILVQYIQQSNYNPINIADESGHTFYYYLLQSSKKQNMSDSTISINSMKQDIRHCKSLGAELNEFDRQQMNKDIQGDLDRLVTAIRDGHLTAIYDIACGLQVYDFAGLDNISAIINKDSMNEYIAECRKDPSLFKKLVEYGNVVRSYHNDPQRYSQPERYYQSIADKMLEDYNQYHAFLPLYSFDKTFDMDKPFRIGVKLWHGEGTVIKSKKTIEEMVSQGELLDYLQEDVFKNPVVQQAIENYNWWKFSRTEARAMDEKTKAEDRFYGKHFESYYSNNGKRVINFRAYEELKELLKQDIQNKIAHLQRLNDDFIALAKSIKQSGSSIDKFNAMYKDLVSDNVYTPNELMYSALIRQYHPDKLMSKVESGELTEKQAKEIKDNIARLNGMRNAYQKEQLAKE